MICNQRVGGSSPSASSISLVEASAGERRTARYPASVCRVPGCRVAAGPVGRVGTAAGTRGTVGEVAERSNATDCKSVAQVASEVRILPSPPAFARDAREGCPPKPAGRRRATLDASRATAGRPARRARTGRRRTTVARDTPGRGHRESGGSNSVVESQPSKLLVAGSIPVSRSSLRSQGEGGR